MAYFYELFLFEKNNLIVKSLFTILYNFVLESRTSSQPRICIYLCYKK